MLLSLCLNIVPNPPLARLVNKPRCAKSHVSVTGKNVIAFGIICTTLLGGSPPLYYGVHLGTIVAK